MSNAINPPAFPTTYTDEHGYAQTGIKVKEFFASAALTGILAAAKVDPSNAQAMRMLPFSATDLAWSIADAMMMARAQDESCR